MSTAMILAIGATVLFVVEALIFFAIGYKAGRKDEGEQWVEKKEYYEWLLEMKKRQDFEEVKIVPKKPKKAKKIRYCDICGDVIKSGTICDRCRKVVS
jgi:uncharacterized Fe-S cluster-containing radical SAM superfamily enzyme